MQARLPVRERQLVVTRVPAPVSAPRLAQVARVSGSRQGAASVPRPLAAAMPPAARRVAESVRPRVRAVRALAARREAAQEQRLAAAQPSARVQALARAAARAQPLGRAQALPPASVRQWARVRGPEQVAVPAPPRVRPQLRAWSQPRERPVRAARRGAQPAGRKSSTVVVQDLRWRRCRPLRRFRYPESARCARAGAAFALPPNA